MRILLDTHIFLWYLIDDIKLKQKSKEIIADTRNSIFLSVISFWEITIKYHIRRLPLPEPPETYIPYHRKLHGVQTLPLNEDTILHLSKLPSIHKDPFDRMLICQALENELTIMTLDSTITKYPVEVI